jgi:hypothetical protein
MIQLILFDIPPSPPGAGGAIAVVLLMVSGFIILAAAALAVFLWYRKRGLRGVEMIRRDTLVEDPNQRS